MYEVIECIHKMFRYGGGKLNVEMLRGFTDMLVLKLLKEKDDYGYQLNQQIEIITEGALKLTEATLYTTFKRLLQNQWITTYQGEGKNNIPRKYYAITDLGKKHLISEIESYQKVQTILSAFFKEA